MNIGYDRPPTTDDLAKGDYHLVRLVTWAIVTLLSVLIVSVTACQITSTYDFTHNGYCQGTLSGHQGTVWVKCPAPTK